MRADAMIIGLFLLPMANANVLSQGHPVVGERSDVRFVSSFVALGEPVPAECREEAHVFAESLVRYPHPDEWHWVILCDEAGWQHFLRMSGRDGRDDIYASTDLDARITYLRGDKLLYSGELGARPDEVVAHELAHIRLRSRDETSADGVARAWIKSGGSRIGFGTAQN